MKKIIPIIVSFVLVTAVLTPATTFANTDNSKNKFEKITSNYSKSSKSNISSKYENKKNGNVHKFTIKKKKNKRTVKHLINGEFKSKAVFNKTAGKVKTTTENGKTIVQNTNDLVKKNNKKADKKISTMANGWTFIDSKYSSTWNESGQLFRKPSVEDYDYYTLNISAGTAVSTIASIIDIWATRGGLTAMLRTLGYSIFGSSIDEPIIGSMDATKYKDTLKVISQGKLGLKTYKHRVVTTHNGKTVTAFDGGDSRSYDALLDAGIYNVVVLN